MTSTGSQRQTICSIRCPGSDICVDCLELRDLGHQLAAAEELTRTLKNRILGVKSRINAKTDPVTVKLPIEVICRIFELYADLDRVKEQMISARRGVAEHRSGPLSLGAVCRRWRDIAWSFPALWTTLVLNLDRRGRSLGSELVRQWLERANGRPLAIRFLDIDRSRVMDGSEAFKIIDIINQFSGQWKILDLSGLPYVLLKALNDSQYFDSTTPSQLSHICVSETRFDSFGDPRNSFLHMSRRHRPTFLSFVSSGCPIAMNIDWTSVTQMHISQSLYSFLELMSLAAKAPLNRISLSFLKNDYDPSNLPATQLSTLRHFSVTWSPEVIHSGCLYDTLSLPSLLTFHIDSGVPSWTASSPALDHLCRLFARSACPLLHLEIVNFQLNGRTLAPLLICIPSLRTLILSCVYDAGAIFAELSGVRLEKNSNPFLPVLSSLDVEVSSPCPTTVWMPLADIWDDNPLSDLELIAKHDQRVEKPPIRKDLHVKLAVTCVDNPSPEHFMDRLSLIRMVRLWESDGVIVPIKVVNISAKATKHNCPAPTTPVSNFFEQSYQHHFSGDRKDDDIRQSLVAMLSSLS